MLNNKTSLNKSSKKPINKEKDKSTPEEILDTNLKEDYMDLTKAQNKKIQDYFLKLKKRINYYLNINSN